jgi:2-polyprenyl-3-methyl-5-hydroxy-6-metoxy-1,4-benzoquinol methylase
MERPANDVEIWDKWNSTYRQGRIDEPSKRRLREILASMSDLKIHDAKILEAGCGTGWLSDKLSEFGKVTGVDLGSKIIDTAQLTYPHVQFLSGDVHTIDLPVGAFDVIVTSEVLSHVPDQPAFMRRLSDLLKPGGYLLITTQNKSVFERRNDVAPPDGWIRQWVTISMLKDLLRPHFSIRRLTTLEPEGKLGYLKVVNSSRLNYYCAAVLGGDRIKRLKESAGFGQSIFVIAKKR